MAVIENAKLNGAQLIAELAKTGTGDKFLELPRQVLGFIHRKEKRIASAAEIIDVMEKAGVHDKFKDWRQTPELTLKKAIALAMTGEWNPAATPKVLPVEELLLAGQVLPPEEVKPAAEVAAEEDFEDEGPPDNKMEDALGLKPTRRRRQSKPVADAPVTVGATVGVTG